MTTAREGIDRKDPMKFSDLPAMGAPLGGGLYFGLTTDRSGIYHAVVLLPDRGENLSWEKATAWAEEAGGVLPTRLVSALLFQQAKSCINSGWHWTSEEFDGSCAWGQFFVNGGQFSLHKSYEGRAVAVRLIQLTA